MKSQVVGQNVQHGLPLVGEALVEHVRIPHDVEHGATPLVALSQAALERHLRTKFVRALAVASVSVTVGPGSGIKMSGIAIKPSPLPTAFAHSDLFSKAIIFSSRPTTTSLNFSRSKIDVFEGSALCNHVTKAAALKVMENHEVEFAMNQRAHIAMNSDAVFMNSHAYKMCWDSHNLSRNQNITVVYRRCERIGIKRYSSGWPSDREKYREASGGG